MFRKTLRLLFNFIFLLFFIVCMIWHKMAVYGLTQAKGQLELVWNARPIDEALADPAFPDSLKQKLILVKEIKVFCTDSLGMNPSDNYAAVYDQKGKALLLTVSGCDPYSFTPKEWSFPFLGSVPYKGFFDKEEARKEILKLKTEGYDVDVYSPSGWSTLGWFRDPILSNMLKRDEGELASLIIHELTHGTLFVKDSINFNENLANFIGEKGAEKFLALKFGKESKEYTDFIQRKLDEKIYNDYILDGAKQLGTLYKELGRGKPEEEIKKSKKEIIMDIVVGVNRLPLYKKKSFFRYTEQAFWEGNAFFMSFKRYDSKYDVFETELANSYHSNLKAYLAALKKKWPSL
ncbi:MAG: aminopeptidase [Bacteroidia bacterium]